MLNWLRGSVRQKRCEGSPVVLLVMDGLGLAPPSAGNAVTLAKTPNFDRFFREYPHTELIASGESVGLPANEVGNTEVGHLTMGAGRVIFQDLVRINRAIKDNTIYVNEALKGAVNHVKQHNSALHIMGLIGKGKVHASMDHLEALIQLVVREKLAKVYYHLFTDGRDSPPDACLAVMKEVEARLQQLQAGVVATVAGRYYAMDRDHRWERTEKAYRAMVVGEGMQAASGTAAIEQAYANQLTDEFVEPTVVMVNGAPVGKIQDNDAAIFYNFRVDRPRQLTMALVIPNFEQLTKFTFGFDPRTNKAEGEVAFGRTFKRQVVPQNLFMVTMTEYQEGLPVSAVAYGPQVVKDNVGYVIAAAGLPQLRMAESEKERFVTYYFSGMQELTYPLQEVKIVPSPKVATYDLKPEMSLWLLVKEFKQRLAKCSFRFCVMNWANPDMVAHTGNLPATIKAIEEVDKALGEMERAVLAAGGTLAVTADHGNAEELLTFPQTGFFYTFDKGVVNTEHSNNKVPLILINQAYKGNPCVFAAGALSDLGPTLLPFLGLSAPPSMNGKNLLASRQ